jgi:hypothetical protein
MVPPHSGRIAAGPIPVERGNSPPVEHCDVIVAARMMERSGRPVPRTKLTFRFLHETDLPGDDSRILEVSADLAALRRTIQDRLSPRFSDHAYTSEDGYAYCWLRLKLFDGREPRVQRMPLKGLKVIVGENTGAPGGGSPAMPPGVWPPLLSVGAATALMTAPLLAGGAVPPAGAPRGAGVTDVALPDWLRALKNILVEEGTKAAVTAVVAVAPYIQEAKAALPRTQEEVVGFTLKRIADYFILQYMAPVAVAAHSGLLGPADARVTPIAALVPREYEELRAIVIGVLLGVPRGLYVVGRDQVMDVKALVFDLPRALFNFIEANPQHALQIIGFIRNPAAAITERVVRYALDPEMQKRVDAALARFAGLAEKIGLVLFNVWSAFWQDPVLFSMNALQRIIDVIFSSFETFLGRLPTDYLKYAKDSRSYAFFIWAFMGGDVLGWVLGTVGVEVLLAYVTGGVATYLKVAAKGARLAGWAAKLIEVVQKVFAVLIKIKDELGRVFLAIVQLFKRLNDTLLDAVIGVLSTRTDDAIGMLTRYIGRGADAEDGRRVAALGDALAALSDGPEAADLLDTLADLSKGERFAGVRLGGFVPSC